MLGYVRKPAKGKDEGDHGDNGQRKSHHSDTEEILLAFTYSDNFDRLPEEKGDEKETGYADKKEEDYNDKTHFPNHKVRQKAFCGLQPGNARGQCHAVDCRVHGVPSFLTPPSWDSKISL
jgi:hypothetical protein